MKAWGRASLSFFWPPQFIVRSCKRRLDCLLCWIGKYDLIAGSASWRFGSQTPFPALNPDRQTPPPPPRPGGTPNPRLADFSASWGLTNGYERSHRRSPWKQNARPRLGPQSVPVTGEHAPNTPPGWLGLARTGAWGGRYVPFPGPCLRFCAVSCCVWRR